MLWSCNDDLVSVAVADSQHPCTPSLADDGPGLPVEAAVGHPLLDARLNNNVDPVADFELLDDRSYRRQAALSQLFLEFIPCLLSWTIVMCHAYSPSCTPSTCVTSRLVTRAARFRISARLGRVLPESPDTSSLM